jgi:hypothetical protein
MDLKDALLWLSDRQGKEVTASIDVDHGEKPHDEFEFRVTGTLRHVTAGKPPKVAAKPGVLSGLYTVGDAHLSLFDLTPIKVTTEPGKPNWLIVQIDAHTTLNVYEED